MKEWIRFNKGSNPLDLLNVVKDNNVWNLTREEFYNVLDKNDVLFFLVDKEVKLMIYVNGVKVTGVFGFGEKSNVEDEYLNDLKNELMHFKDNREYMEKVNNLINFAPIYKKFKNDEELTKSDLEIVYQVKKELKAFTGVTEEKMDEIIDSRDAYEDLAEIFGVSASEVALDIDEVTEDTKVLKGNLSVFSDNVDEYKSIEYVIGHVYLESKKLKSNIHIKSAWTIEEL